MLQIRNDPNKQAEENISARETHIQLKLREFSWMDSKTKSQENKIKPNNRQYTMSPETKRMSSETMQGRAEATGSELRNDQTRNRK